MAYQVADEIPFQYPNPKSKQAGKGIGLLKSSEKRRTLAY